MLITCIYHSREKVGFSLKMKLHIICKKKKKSQKVKKQKHEVDINASIFNINLYKTSFQILT